MFEHDQRENFLDLLRPPTGYRLEAAVGTTFSLDFVSLTAAMLAFVDGEIEDPNSPSGQIDALHAITRLAARVRVFVNRGQISSQVKLSRLTILYDQIIREVSLPEGCFHPKVWITYYRPRQRSDSLRKQGLVRFVCTSRNLTSSQYWEAFVACEGREESGKASDPINGEIKSFLSRLEDREPASPINELMTALGRIRFDLPKHMQAETHFLWQWQGGKQLHRNLPSRGHKAMLVSPFVRKSFLADIVSRFDRLVVISTQHELDAIEDESLIARLMSGRNKLFVVEAVDTDSGSTAMDLHAKLLICEDSDKTQMFLGSANASSSAWGGLNCEAMMLFAPGISIDHFCDRFVYSKEPVKRGERRSLRGWISEYRRQPRTEDDQDCAERQLDDICRRISRLQIMACYDLGNQSLQIKPMPDADALVCPIKEWSQSHNLRVGLLSLLHSESDLRPLMGLFTEGITFSNVAVADLTDFLVLQVSDRHIGLQRRFIVKVLSDFSHLREDRNAQLLRQLLTKDSLYAFLRAILFDAVVRPGDALSSGGYGARGGTSAATILSQTSIEEVIQACTEDSTRIEEINRLINAFGKTGLIDEEFLQFWSIFIEADAEARKEVMHG